MKLYIIICLILVLLFCIFINNYTYEHFELYNINSVNLGNALSVYYFNIILSTLKQEDFAVHDSDKDFLKYLPKKIKYNILAKYYTQLQDANITLELFTKLYDTDGNSNTGINFWNMTDTTKEKIHFIMKPFIHKLFDDALQKSGLQESVNVPVIHFRCADTPFSKHPEYLFQKYSYFKDALNDINKKSNLSYDSVILLSCSSHNSSEQYKKACSKYTGYLSKYLKSIQYDVDVQCSSELADFSTMFYAPAVISTSSSYSFMAGFFGKGIFINTTQFNGDIEQCLDCGDWLYKGYNVKHELVNDYHDTENVYSLLK